MHHAPCFTGVTSIEIGVCLLKNLARMSRCGPSLVQYVAKLVISRSFVSYKSRKGTTGFFEKTTPNVHQDSILDHRFDVDNFNSESGP